MKKEERGGSPREETKKQHYSDKVYIPYNSCMSSSYLFSLFSWVHVMYIIKYYYAFYYVYCQPGQLNTVKKDDFHIIY